MNGGDEDAIMFYCY